MDRKARKLKRDLVWYKGAGVVDIVFAIIIWIGVAYSWGTLQMFRESLPLPWSVVVAILAWFIILGISLLAGGIAVLQLTGKVNEILRDVWPDEDDE